MKQTRPNELYGTTRRIMTGCGYIYVTINSLNDKPFEVFVKLGKAGGCSASYTEALGKIISVALRSGTALGEIAEKLQGVGCNIPILGGAKSCSDAIAQILRKEIIDLESAEILDSPEIELEEVDSDNEQKDEKSPKCP